MEFKEGDIVRYKDYFERPKINWVGMDYVNCTRFKLMCDSDSSNNYNVGYLLDNNYEMILEDNEIITDSYFKKDKYKHKTLDENEMELDIVYYRKLKLEKIKSKIYE